MLSKIYSYGRVLLPKYGTDMQHSSVPLHWTCVGIALWLSKCCLAFNGPVRLLIPGKVSFPITSANKHTSHYISWVYLRTMCIEVLIQRIILISWVHWYAYMIKITLKTWNLIVQVLGLFCYMLMI